MVTSHFRLIAALTLLLGSTGGAEAQPVKKVPVGPGVTLEVEGSSMRVVVESTVVLRKGALEGLLTRAKKKEHEYILAADVDARHIHTALLLARAQAGSPAQFQPQFRAPTGSPIRVRLRYTTGGKAITVPAGEWLRDARGRKHMAGNWVFAGSRLGPNPEGGEKPPFYMANHGDLICVCNMETALLDIPVRSPKAFNDRLYEADTDRIPEKGTKVEVILEPVPPAKPRP